MSWKLALTLALCVVAATAQPGGMINQVITKLMAKKLDFFCPDLSDADGKKICQKKATKCMSALTPFMYGDGTKNPLEIYKTCKNEATQIYGGPRTFITKFFGKKEGPETTQAMQAMQCCIGKEMEILNEDNVTINKTIPIQMFDEKIELLGLLKMGVESCPSVIDSCQLDEFCNCTMQYCIGNVLLE